MSSPSNSIKQLQNGCFHHILEDNLSKSLETQQIIEQKQTINNGDNFIKGVYCSKTNTFYSTEDIKQALQKKYNTQQTSIWLSFDDFLLQYGNHEMLDIELKQIL